MNMPGFTAEASVYKTSGHYHREAGWAGTVDIRTGLAQVTPALGACRVIPGKCHFDPDLGGCFIENQRADCTTKLIPCRCPPRAPDSTTLDTTFPFPFLVP